MDFIFICVYIENLKQKDVVKGDFFSGLEPSPCFIYRAFYSAPNCSFKGGYSH